MARKMTSTKYLSLLTLNKTMDYIYYQALLQDKLRRKLREPQHVRDLTHDRRPKAQHQVHRVRHSYIAEGPKPSIGDARGLDGSCLPGVRRGEDVTLSQICKYL